MKPNLSITGDTRVAELLEAYPHLEEVMVQQAPPFKLLKNPILRRTVARVATLRKAAEMGGIPVQQLVRTLREAAGISTEDRIQEETESDSESPPTSEPLPEWVVETKVRVTVDADALLERGEFPLASVQKIARDLKPGELVSITSTFRPVPLVEALENCGFRTCVVRESASLFRTYVSRPN